MPYKSEAIIIDHTSQDKRIKLTNYDKVKILELWIGGMSIRGLARMYDVDKRLIQFTLFPERKKRNLELREVRGGSARYYDRERQNQYQKDHRRYKQDLFKRGVIS